MKGFLIFTTGVVVGAVGVFYYFRKVIVTSPPATTTGGTGSGAVQGSGFHGSANYGG